MMHRRWLASPKRRCSAVLHTVRISRFNIRYTQHMLHAASKHASLNILSYKILCQTSFYRLSSQYWTSPCWMVHNVTYRFTKKLWWQITVDPVEPATASEYSQFGDDVIVSAVTRQWIVVDRQHDFATWTDDWCLKETENIQITCSHTIHTQVIVIIITRWLLRRHNMESNSRAPALEVIGGEYHVRSLWPLYSFIASTKLSHSQQTTCPINKRYTRWTLTVAVNYL